MQDLPVRLIGKREVFAHDIPLRADCRLIRPLRQIQQTEYFIARRHAVHRDMEERAELPHGNKEIGRQKNDQQASCQNNVPRPVLCGRHDDSQSRTAAMETGISGTQTSRITADGIFTKHRQAKSVSGAEPQEFPVNFFPLFSCKERQAGPLPPSSWRCSPPDSTTGP